MRVTCVISALPVTPPLLPGSVGARKTSRVGRVHVLVVLAFAVSGGVVSACGAESTGSSATQQAGSTRVQSKSAYLQTLEPDWDSYKAGLARESATCPVPKVTVQSMNECKKAMVALDEIDEAFIADLRDLDVPPKIQPAIRELSVSLAALKHAHATIIHRYIDKQDIEGFMSSAGPGSPLDNATKHSNDAITQIDLLDPSAELEATVFTAPS
jgi:hypothetical protein